MAQYFKSNPKVFALSTTDGIKRVRQEKYAFILESGYAEHVAANRPCDMVVLGDTIRESSYSFACRPNTNTCDQLNIAILQLKMNGRLDILKAKWWSGPCPRYTVTKTGSSTKAGSPLDLRRFAIPLVLLIGGVVLSVIVLLLEIYVPSVAGVSGACSR